MGRSSFLGCYAVDGRGAARSFPLRRIHEVDPQQDGGKEWRVGRAVWARLFPQERSAPKRNPGRGRSTAMKRWALRNWFLFGLLAALALAVLWPRGGASGGVLRAEETTRWAVMALFFLRGLLLPVRELAAGALRWRLHAATHGLIFLAAPLLAWGGLGIWEIWFDLDRNLRTGFFLLAVLPTTIASAAGFTVLAGGNTAGAVFNATASNLIGVVLTPLWMGWFLAVRAEPLPVGPVVGQVAFLIVLPLLAGQGIKLWIPPLGKRTARWMETAGHLLILFLLYAAFANSVQSGVFREVGPATLAGVAAGAAGAFAVMTILARATGVWGRFGRPDRICLLFCGPQKTLAAGVPLANLLFPGDPALSLILLPLVVYHFIQLLVGGWLAERLREKSNAG